MEGLLGERRRSISRRVLRRGSVLRAVRGRQGVHSEKWARLHRGRAALSIAAALELSADGVLGVIRLLVQSTRRAAKEEGRERMVATHLVRRETLRFLDLATRERKKRPPRDPARLSHRTHHQIEQTRDRPLMSARRAPAKSLDAEERVGLGRETRRAATRVAAQAGILVSICEDAAVHGEGPPRGLDPVGHDHIGQRDRALRDQVALNRGLVLHHAHRLSRRHVSLSGGFSPPVWQALK